MEPAQAGAAPRPAGRILILLAWAAGLEGLVLLVMSEYFQWIPPVPLWFFYDQPVLQFAAIPSLFLAWSIPQFRGKPELSSFSILLVLATAPTLLSAAYLVASWNYGLEWQGLEYTAFQVLLDAGLAVGAFITARQLRRRPSWGGTVAWKASVVGWLTLFAFPYLGETP